MNVLKKLALASTLVGFSAIASAADTWVGSAYVEPTRYSGGSLSSASNCSWSNWAYMTMGRQAVLTCDGTQVASFFHNVAYDNCSVSSVDSAYKVTGSNCSRTFYKKAAEIPVYPGDQCSWVQKQSYYGYDYYDFKCLYHGVVATKTVGYPWSYSSPGYSCSIGAKTGFNVTTTGTGLGDTQCDVTKVTK